MHSDLSMWKRFTAKWILKKRRKTGICDRGFCVCVRESFVYEWLLTAHSTVDWCGSAAIKSIVIKRKRIKICISVNCVLLLRWWYVIVMRVQPPSNIRKTVFSVIYTCIFLIRLLRDWDLEFRCVMRAREPHVNSTECAVNMWLWLWLCHCTEACILSKYGHIYSASIGITCTPSPSSSSSLCAHRTTVGIIILYCFVKNDGKI